MSSGQPTTDESDRVPGWPASWLRPKGNLSHAEIVALLTIAIVPLLVVLVRILSLPELLGPSLSGTWLPSLGASFDQMLSLQDVPARERGTIVYVLFLPTSALIIAIARLTFGIRVIGFRAILISVGFQQSGIVPSLILIFVVVTIIIFVRPTLKRIQLHNTALLSVIMSIGVIVLVTALLTAPWMRSEVLWRVAFFPVIVLGLLAESIAKTLDRNTGLVAIWRTGMTIGIAMLIAGISQIPLVREVVIQFPELVVTQIVLIILVSEYLDLQIFGDWDATLSGQAIPRLFSGSHALRVAIVRNRRGSGVIGQMGVRARSGYSRATVRRIAAALREQGHTVHRFEGDMTLLAKLRSFLPTHPQTREPGGIVLDLSSGIQGTSASGHVAAMLEMAGVSYAGATPVGHALVNDRVVASRILRLEGLATPELRVVTRPGQTIDGMAYPVVVRPRHGSAAGFRVVQDREKLDRAVERIFRREGSEAIVEQYIAGREIEVALIGNDPIDCLPLIEVLPDSGERACPARLDRETEARVQDTARKAFQAVGGRDAARVQLRLSRSGTAYVMAIESLGGLEEDGTFERAGAAAGLSFPALIDRILEVARERYRANPGPPALSLVTEPLDTPTRRKGTFIAST